MLDFLVVRQADARQSNHFAKIVARDVFLVAHAETAQCRRPAVDRKWGKRARARPPDSPLVAVNSSVLKSDRVPCRCVLEQRPFAVPGETGIPCNASPPGIAVRLSRNCPAGRFSVQYACKSCAIRTNAFIDRLDRRDRVGDIYTHHVNPTMPRLSRGFSCPRRMVRPFRCHR